MNVRDIPRLHVWRYMARRRRPGSSSIGSGDFYWMKDMAAMLRRRLKRQGSELPALVPFASKVGTSASGRFRASNRRNQVSRREAFKEEFENQFHCKASQAALALISTV